MWISSANRAGASGYRGQGPLLRGNTMPPGADCRSGPCPRFRAQGALLQGMVWVGQRRSGSHPRIAPEVPAIADKVRSYGEMPCLTVDWAGPARDSRAGRAPTGEWCGWGSVGVDLIRESRRGVRLSRTRSATGKHHASRRIVGAGPAREIVRRARSYREWCGWGCVGSHPRIAPEVPVIADKVRGAGAPRCFS